MADTRDSTLSKTAIATRTKEEDTFTALLIVMTLLHGTNGSMKLVTCTSVGNSEPGELLSGSSAVSAAFVTSELQNCSRLCATSTSCSNLQILRTSLM